MRSEDMDRYEQTIQLLREKNQYRCLSFPPVDSKDFSSNDYLGLATNLEMRKEIANFLLKNEWAAQTENPRSLENPQSPENLQSREDVHENGSIGSGASRLLRGNFPIHEECEKVAAQFFGSQSSLYFSSGFMANFAIMTTLVRRSDVVFFDEEIHASLKEGIHASKAKYVKFHHNNLGDLENAIVHTLQPESKTEQPKNETRWLVLEALYSMSGIAIDLTGYLRLAGKYNLFLILDEAHSTGIYSKGRGLAWTHIRSSASKNSVRSLQNENTMNVRLMSVHTCGKAWGGSGAFVCGDNKIIDYMINHARPFIFSTGVSPIFAFHMMRSIYHAQYNPDYRERRERHSELTGLANDLIKEKTGCAVSGTHIIPIVLGDNAQTLRISQILQQTGFDVRAIRPPTVKKGTARLRISITLNVEKEDVHSLLDCMSQHLGKNSYGFMMSKEAKEANV